MSIKWGVNSYCACLQVRQEGSVWLHTNENTFTYSGNKVTYQINIVTYRQEIVTYWNLCCYRPQINKGFQAISCFYASVTLLSWNAIKRGLIVTYQWKHFYILTEYFYILFENCYIPNKYFNIPTEYFYVLENYFSMLFHDALKLP